VTWLRTAFTAAAWLYLAGIVIQVFFAGASLFELTDWTVHTELGWSLGSAPVLLLVLALGARVDRRTTWLTVGLAIAALVQPELAAARNEAPVVAALHPVNAMLVFWLAWTVARRSTAPARQLQGGSSGRAAVPTTDAPPSRGTA
jgi:hypothetical protein